MPQVSLEWLGEKLTELIAEVRAMRVELSAMRSEIEQGRETLKNLAR